MGATIAGGILKINNSTSGPNWWRVLGNAGLAFFTVLAATNAAGYSGYMVAIWAAFIQGGLAFFQEVLREAGTPTIPAGVFLL